MSKKIIFSTGGTGGHILPAVHLMKHFFEKGYEVLIVTDVRGNKFLEEYPEFKSYVLPADTTTNKNFVNKILALKSILYSIIKSFFILKKERPNLIFGLGGYASFPISIASRFFKLPLVLYENNLILGRANKFLLTFSKKVLLAKEMNNNFPQKYKQKTSIVGAVLSKKILNPILVQNNKNNFFSIIVLGGSQGAEEFGNIIPTVINKLKNQGYSIKINQQCTNNQKKNIENFYKKNNIKNYVFGFEKNIYNLILSSDLAITRCGASTTAELVHALTPFIAVPLPNSIDNHQYLNAKYYEEKDCCWVLEQSNFNTESLFNLIMETIKNKYKLEKIRENMKKHLNKNVYNDIEKEIESLI